MTPWYQELTDRWAREEARALDEQYEEEMFERYVNRNNRPSEEPPHYNPEPEEALK